MSIHSKKWVAITAILASFTLMKTISAEERFPKEPIQLVIPFAPGDTDKMLRPIADRMSGELGHPVVLNYKPGAGGGVGASQVAIAKADGYTLVGSSPGALVIVPLANKEFTYDTESFTPVASFSKGALMLLVPADSPFKTLGDLIATAKDKPGTITYGSSGMMGITHLLTEIFAQDANIQLTHVPYKGSTPAVVDLMGKEIDVAAVAVGPAIGYIQAGTLRPLAIFSDKRMAIFPDVPTVAELGYGIGSPTLYGIVAPKGTSKERVDVIYQAAKKAVADHQENIALSLATLGGEIALLGPDEYAAYLQEQKQLFSKGISGLKTPVK